jgi:hypothetical protein
LRQVNFDQHLRTVQTFKGLNGGNRREPTGSKEKALGHGSKLYKPVGWRFLAKLDVNRKVGKL